MRPTGSRRRDCVLSCGRSGCGGPGLTRWGVIVRVVARLVAMVAVALGLVWTGLPGVSWNPTDPLAPQASVAQAAVPAGVKKANVITMKPGRTYQVKMAGKLRKVKLTVGACSSWWDDGWSLAGTCETRPLRVYVGETKVLSGTTREPEMDSHWSDGFELVKVSATDTLLAKTYPYSRPVVYRFDGTKAVKLGAVGSTSGSGTTITAAGSARLIAESWDTNVDPLMYTYAKGKLKRTKAGAGDLLAKRNVTYLKAGKTYSVKMAGKTRKVRLTRKCVEHERFGSEKLCVQYQVRLYIDGKRRVSRSQYWEEAVSYVLLRVTSKETLLQAIVSGTGGWFPEPFYRSNGKKLVKVGRAGPTRRLLHPVGRWRTDSPLLV